MRLVGVQQTEQETPVAPSDEALVRLVRNGDVNQAEALVRRYQPALVRYLRRLCGNDQLAEELHQHTWLKVLENIGKFDAASSPGGFKAWLFRIATNLANDLWRSKGRERTAKAGLRLVTEQEAPESGYRAEQGEEEQKLKRMIEQLPEAQKQVLVLRYYGNMKFVEIAEMLGCPLNTALGRMHKAMLKLKELMESQR